MFKPLNLFGEPLKKCSLSPITGFYRDGSCNSGIDNQAWHMVCIQVTEEFLRYSKNIGNDLSTPMPKYNFKGLKEGDSWCLAVGNFIRAIEDGFAPKIFLHSTHQAVLELIELEVLEKYALDKEKL
jgi:hypothetical protein